MRGKLVYPYSDSLLGYEFRQDHPLKPDRLRLTYLLSKQLGLIDKVNVVDPVDATREQIELFHSPDFVDAVIRAGQTLDPEYRYGLGISDNPVFPNIYDAAVRYVGATLEGMKEIIKGASNAFCISGGLHHASTSAASGFCIFNDAVIAIKYLLSKKSARVLYFDFDAHHGDGVQEFFYNDPGVLTLSIHETGRILYPGTGFAEELGVGPGLGYSVNVPLPPYTMDEAYLNTFEVIVPPIVEAYHPEVIVMQFGVDTHFQDTLGHLALTTRTFSQVARRIHQLAHDNSDGKLVIVSGGGYSLYSVPRCWTLMLGELIGFDVPDDIPEKWQTLFKEITKSEPPVKVRDDQEPQLPRIDMKRINQIVELGVKRVKQLVFPKLNIDPS